MSTCIVKSGRQLRVLIFDTNIVFARQAGLWLTDLLGDAVTVEYAQNGSVLLRRMRDNTYDCILADPITAFDSDEVEHILHEYKKSAAIIVWSFMNPASGHNNKIEFQNMVQKPGGTAELPSEQLRTIVSEHIAAAV